MEHDRESRERNAGLVLRYIEAIAAGIESLVLLSREGWAIGSSAVIASSWLCDEAGRDGDSGAMRAAEAGARAGADVYAKMVAAATGRMPSIAAAMEAVAGPDRTAVANLETLGARLRVLGPFDAIAATARLDALVGRDLVTELRTTSSELAMKLRGLIGSNCPEPSTRDGNATTMSDQIRGNGKIGSTSTQRKEQEMDEGKSTEKVYAHVKAYPADIRMTKRVFENENGTKRTSTFVHCPKGMQINGVDLSGYEVRTTLAEFQVDSIKSGKPISIGFDADRPITVFKGFDEMHNMIDPMEFNAWDFCSAMKAATTARETAKDNYVRINIPAHDVRAFEQTSRAGKTYQKAAATLPQGTVVDGRDVSGRTAFFFMSRFNAADLAAGRDTISFSVRRDDEFDLLADRGSGEAALRTTGETLAEAVRSAAERALEGSALDDDRPMGASLADLESSTRTTTSAMAQTPAGEAPVR